MAEALKVGLLGFGVVGGATARVLLDHADEVSRRAGVSIELARIAVRDRPKVREVALPQELFTTSPEEIVSDPSIDVVVELMGGSEPARTLLLEAIANKKHVVTANKELLSTFGREVMSASETNGVNPHFEASAGGGIPII